MKCECCHEEGFLYERKIVDETFFLCYNCDWSTEDIEAANKIGDALIKIIGNSLKNANGKPN